MQYLLTHDEYIALKNKDDIKANQLKQTLQQTCTYAADNIPVKCEWSTVASPWGCILTTEGEHCCDHCPVESQCPYDDKQWSK